ncbi:MAG: YbbR-like domain-containing protein [Bacteroidales bacterium]
MNLQRLKRYYYHLREPAGKRKATIFLVCFFCSAFFWVLVKLSKENQAMFSQPFVITEVPESVSLFEQSDSLLQYSVQTSGARLLASMFFTSRDTLGIPLSALTRIERGGETLHFFTRSQASARLAARMEAGKSIGSVSPDTVFVRLAEKLSRVVPIRVLADLSYEQRFGSDGPLLLDPDSVLLEGPRHLLDTILYVETEPLVFRDLSQTIAFNVSLVPPARHHAIRLTPEQTRVTVPVAEYTEATIEVPLVIDCPDSPEGFRADWIRLFPNTVEITYLVSLRDYPSVVPEMFQARVVCPEGSFEGPQLEVVIEQIPDFVRLESFRPGSVDYLIIR